jgi:hypothetical protein
VWVGLVPVEVERGALKFIEQRFVSGRDPGSRRRKIGGQQSLGKRENRGPGHTHAKEMTTGKTHCFCFVLCAELLARDNPEIAR